jgi:hypothetical protein
MSRRVRSLTSDKMSGTIITDCRLIGPSYTPQGDRMQMQAIELLPICCIRIGMGCINNRDNKPSKTKQCFWGS